MTARSADARLLDRELGGAELARRVRHLDLGADHVGLRRRRHGRIALLDEPRRALDQPEVARGDLARALRAPEVRVGALRERDGVERDAVRVVAHAVGLARRHLAGERPLAGEGMRCERRRMLLSASSTWNDSGKFHASHETTGSS
jgi:hypothetical protein